ncbi:MAG: Flp family type IVb pilin [Alphaproteobacteria bacterium]
MPGYIAMRRYIVDESGASAVEYGMVVTILSLSLLAIIGTGSSLGSLYDTVVVKIAEAL